MKPGDKLEGKIEGVGTIALTIGPAEALGRGTKARRQGGGAISAPASEGARSERLASARLSRGFRRERSGRSCSRCRLWVSVCLALYVAFALQLSDPSWAGTTAALICQPQLGASLRKGAFRLVGTVVGGVAIVVIAALFPQRQASVSCSVWRCGAPPAALSARF